MARNFTGIQSVNFPGVVPQPQALKLCQADALPPYSLRFYLDWNLAVANATALNGGNVPTSLAVGIVIPDFAMSQMGAIRSVYIDNTGSNQPIYLQATDTGFVITASPRDAAWYPIITNSNQFLCVTQGLQPASLPLTIMFFANRQIGPHSDPEIPEAVELRYASPIIGGGSKLNTITVLTLGAFYNAATLSITGGGGSGAVGAGSLDRFGRFISASVSNGGAGFLSPPVITATGSQSTPAGWNDNTVYNTNQVVMFNGTAWGANQTNPNTSRGAWTSANSYNTNDTVFWGASIGGTDHCYSAKLPIGAGGPNPNNTIAWFDLGSYQPGIGALSSWSNSGLSAPATATFQGNLAVPANPIVSTGFGVPALGDQTAAGISVNAPGVGATIAFPAFGPYAGPMFCIITAYTFKHIASVSNASQVTLNAQLEGASSGAIMLWHWTENILETSAGWIQLDKTIDTMSGINLILDATDTYQIRVTAASAGTSGFLEARFFYTLNPRQ